MYSSSIILNLLKKEKKTDPLEDWENSSSREFPVIKITDINRATIRFLEPRWPAVSRKRIFRSSQLSASSLSTSKSDGWSIFFTAGHHPISSVAVEDDARSTSGPLYLNIVEDRRREDGRAASLMCEPLIAARSSRWSSSSSSRGGRVTSKVIERWARAERRGVVSIPEWAVNRPVSFQVYNPGKNLQPKGAENVGPLPQRASSLRRSPTVREIWRPVVSLLRRSDHRSTSTINPTQSRWNVFLVPCFICTRIDLLREKKKITDQFLMGDCKLVEYRV